MRILVVDDEPDIRGVPSEWLSGQGYQVRALNDESEVLTVLGHGRYGVVILDLVRPKANGLALISHIQSLSPNTSAIVISAAVDVRLAVEATKAGAETASPNR